MTDASTEQYQRESLDAFLDWPVQFEESDVWCANPECPACPGDASHGITSWYGLSPRRLCEAIKRHVGRADSA